MPESDARSVISTQTFRRALTPVYLQWCNQFWQTIHTWVGAGRTADPTRTERGCRLCIHTWVELVISKGQKEVTDSIYIRG